jgi:hypothetical protein
MIAMCYYRFIKAKKREENQRQKEPTAIEKRRYEKRKAAVGAVQRGESPKAVARVFNIPLTDRRIVFPFPHFLHTFKFFKKNLLMLIFFSFLGSKN